MKNLLLTVSILFSVSAFSSTQLGTSLAGQFSIEADFSIILNNTAIDADLNKAIKDEFTSLNAKDVSDVYSIGSAVEGFDSVVTLTEDGKDLFCFLSIQKGDLYCGVISKINDQKWTITDASGDSFTLNKLN